MMFVATPAAKAQPVSVRVAVPAPMSGLQAPMGRAVHAAATMVTADLNTVDSTVKLELVLLEDACRSADAQRLAETVAAAKFDAVIGFPCRASAQAAGPVFARTGQVLIATAPVVPPFGLAQSGPTVFRLPVAETSLGQYLGRQLAAAPAEARIAIVRDKTQQAISLAQAVEAGVRASGRTVQVTEIFTAGDKAFAPLVARLKARGVTHVALLAFPVEGGLIAAELTAAIPQIEMLAPDFAATGDTPLIAGAAAARLRVVLPQRDPLGAGEAGEALFARLRAQDINAGAEALTVAAAVEIYADAVRRVGSADPVLVAAALRAAPTVPSRYGGAAFDLRGQRVAPYWGMFRWSDGQLVPAQ